MAASVFGLGELHGYEASTPVRVGNVACERFQFHIFGGVVGMMSVCAGVFCGIAGRLAEGCNVGRRPRVADFSRAFSHLTLVSVAREIPEAGAAAKRAAR